MATKELILQLKENESLFSIGEDYIQGSVKIIENDPLVEYSIEELGGEYIVISPEPTAVGEIKIEYKIEDVVTPPAPPIDPNPPTIKTEIRESINNRALVKLLKTIKNMQDSIDSLTSMINKKASQNDLNAAILEMRQETKVIKEMLNLK